METTTRPATLADIGIFHHFAGGLYAKEMRIPEGAQVIQHAHRYDHLSALMEGKAAVYVDGVATIYVAPKLITVAAYKHHSVLAITDVVWACIHATDETDPKKVDEGLIA